MLNTNNFFAFQRCRLIIKLDMPRLKFGIAFKRLDFAGFPNYCIDRHGTVYNINGMKPLKQQKSKKGYMYVHLRHKGKDAFKQVHRLVAQAFLPDFRPELEVNHKNCNRAENSISNLEMLTHRENQLYSAIPKKYRAVVQYSKSGEYIAEYPSQKHASEATGVASRHISSCCTGKIKSAGGYVWKHKDGKEYPKMQTVTRGLMIGKYDLDGNIIATYTTALAAAKSVGADGGSITAVIKGDYKTLHGYQWRAGKTLPMVIPPFKRKNAR